MKRLREYIGAIAIAACVMIGVSIYSYTMDAKDVVKLNYDNEWVWTEGFLSWTIILFIAIVISVGYLIELNKEAERKNIWHKTLYTLGVLSGVANGIICIVFWSDGPNKIDNDYSIIKLISICGGIPMWISGAMAIYGWFNLDKLLNDYSNPKPAIVTNNIPVDKNRDVEFLRFKADVVDCDNSYLKHYQKFIKDNYIMPDLKDEMIQVSEDILKEATRLKIKYPGVKPKGLKDFNVIIRIHQARIEKLSGHK